MESVIAVADGLEDFCVEEGRSAVDRELNCSEAGVAFRKPGTGRRGGGIRNDSDMDVASICREACSRHLGGACSKLEETV